MNDFVNFTGELGIGFRTGNWKANRLESNGMEGDTGTNQWVKLPAIHHPYNSSQHQARTNAKTKYLKH